ncbi:MAG: glycosyltransferase family 2 protein [Candidatus Omnitrophica bacterium]|nr:glycosyltransferase family 2 protein [Candidatus Omnitrophota bacterium]MDD5488140.1 glycosyltransferase family 2 protein [Candidatus Omnitrophota bacterium]
MKISVIMPVYNEKDTILEIIRRVEAADFDKEVILVDDASRDGTREMLRERYGEGSGRIKVFYHDVNQGKGAALSTGIRHASGAYVVVQDADLEYSPSDIKGLVEVAEKEQAPAVYGSRFKKTWKVTSFPHFFVNWALTVMTNIMFGGRLTDMETCYKLVRSDIMKAMEIESKRFDVEPEVTAKLLRNGYRIMEVAISYDRRGYKEGKKIGWRDGIAALRALLRYRFTPRSNPCPDNG